MELGVFSTLVLLQVLENTGSLLYFLQFIKEASLLLLCLPSSQICVHENRL